MVLYKRKYVAPLPSQQVQREDQEVWVIPQTGEYFLDYDAFLSRMDFYKSRQFVCEITGHSNLTFFEAYNSEIRESRGVDTAFPEPLKAPVLRLVQFSTISRMDNLVEAVYDHFRGDFYPGELVSGNFYGERREVVIREKSTFNEMRLTDGTLRPAFSRYRVELRGTCGREEVLHEQFLARERNTFTKAILRAFIKQAVTRDSYNGAPWIVRDRYAHKYHIDTAVLGEFVKKLEDKPKKVTNNGTIKYPIDDLDLPPEGTVRPALKRDTLFHPQLIGLALECWTFLNIYSEVFIFDSFTYDDFVDAIHYNSDGATCELFVEIHCALLKTLIAKDTAKIEFSLPLSSEVTEDHSDEENVKEDSASNDSSLSDPTPNQRVEELYEDGSSWTGKIKRRELSDGGWEMIIVGLLRDLSPHVKYSALAEQVLQHLLPIEKAITSKTVQEMYTTLDPNLKLQILHTLCQLSMETSVVRGYIDDCSESSTELRKEKIESQRSRRTLTESLHQAEDLLKKHFPKGYKPPASPSPSPEVRGDSEDTLSDADESVSLENGVGERKRAPIPSTTRSKTGSTPASLRKRKENEQIARAKGDPQVKKLQSDIAELRERIDECEDRVLNFDHDLREADCPRLRCLGKDRFFNRYWWAEINGMPYGGMPDSSTAYAGYAMGRLWLQGPTEDDKEVFLSQRGIGAKRVKEEGASSLLASLEDWGYYDDEESIQVLINWLNARGERELRLKNSLTSIQELLTDGFQQRQKYLQREGLQEGRPSTRTTQLNDFPIDRCLQWRNHKAIEIIGHLHVEKAKRPAAVTQRRGRARIKRRW